MEIPDFRYGDSEFSWISGLLPPIHSRFLQDYEAHDEASPERSQVQLDFGLRSSLSEIEDFIDYCTSLDPTRCHQAVRCVLRCIRNRSWMCFDARRESCCICLSPMEKARRALCNPRLRASRCGSRSQDLATLPLRQCLSYLYRSQEPQVYLYPIRVEYEATKMVRVDQGL